MDKKNILNAMLKLPVSLGRIKRCWKDRGKGVLFVLFCFELFGVGACSRIGHGYEGTRR